MPRLRIFSPLLFVGAAIFLGACSEKMPPTAVATSPAQEKIEVTVMGAVYQPAKLKLNEGCHLSDAIAAAGGVLRSAKLQSIFVTAKDTNGHEERKTYDFVEISEKKVSDPILINGTRIFVPEFLE